VQPGGGTLVSSIDKAIYEAATAYVLVAEGQREQFISTLAHDLRREQEEIVHHLESLGARLQPNPSARPGRRPVSASQHGEPERGAVSFHLRVHAGFELTQRRRTPEDADAARGAVLTTVRVDAQQRADFLPARVLHRV